MSLKQLTRPIFVVGNPKSGTSLVQALLDGHSSLFTIPVELQFFKFPRLPSLPPGNMPPPPDPSWKTPLPRSAQGLKDLTEEVLSHSELERLLNSGEVGRGICLKGDDFDPDEYLDAVVTEEVSSLKELYTVLCRGFPKACSDPRRVEEYRIVEKCPHMEEYAAELQSWFPEASFIHVIRNPYANLWSNISAVKLKHRVRDRYVRHMGKSYYFMERNERYLRNYNIVRYEDVVLDTEETIKDLADNLGIDFQKSLMTPTIRGRSWAGNSRSVDGGFEGIDTRPVRAFRNHIHSFLVAVVNRYFDTLLSKYEYDRLEVGRLKPWVPMRWETPFQYWRNRRLLWDGTL